MIAHLDTAPSSAADGLRHALLVWSTLSDRATSGLADGDVAAAGQAIAERDALRTQLAQLIGRVRAEGGPGVEEMQAIQQLQQAAAEADTRLVDAIQDAQMHLRGEIDQADRAAASASPYGRTGAGASHRLDIVR